MDGKTAGKPIVPSGVNIRKGLDRDQDKPACLYSPFSTIVI